MARRRMRRGRLALGALAVAVLLAAMLAGCTKTVTVSYKYRSAVGFYWVCTGPRIAPCINGARYRVSQGQYDEAQVGHRYTVTIP
jgi:hypothetical protein